MLTKIELDKIFHYNSDTGAITRRSNGKKVGTVEVRRSGHERLRVAIGNKSFLAHRICWIMFYGSEPCGVIDHIDGDGKNNAIANLKDTSQQINNKNKRIYKTNKSGLSGVTFSSGRWSARATVRARSVRLGSFNTLFDAACARISFINRMNYTERHGR